MPNNSYNMSPWSESEVHDLKRLDEGKRFMLDPRVMEWQRQAGNKSQYFSDLRNKANVHDELQRMNYNQRGKERDIIDRDMRWQGEQRKYEIAEKNAEAERAYRDKELGYKEKAYSDALKEKELERKLTVVKARLNDPNPLIRAQAEDDYNRIIAEYNGGGASSGAGGASGGPMPSTSQGVTPPIPSTGGAAAVPSAGGGTSTTGTTTYKELLLKEYRDKQRRDEEERARQAEREAWEFANTKAAAAEARSNKQKEIELGLIDTALSRTKDPTRENELLNKAAGVTARLEELVNAPNKGLINTVVGEGLTNAWNTASEKAQADARNTFTTDPLAKKLYEAGQVTQGRGIDVEKVRTLAESDPTVTTLLTQLKESVDAAADLPWYTDVGDAIGSIWGSTPSEQDPALIQEAKSQLEAAAKAITQLDPSIDENTARTVIQNMIENNIKSAPTAVRKQLRGMFAPQSPFAPSISGQTWDGPTYQPIPGQ